MTRQPFPRTQRYLVSVAEGRKPFEQARFKAILFEEECHAAAKRGFGAVVLFVLQTCVERIIPVIGDALPIAFAAIVIGGLPSTWQILIMMSLTAAFVNKIGDLCFAK